MRYTFILLVIIFIGHGVLAQERSLQGSPEPGGQSNANPGAQKKSDSLLDLVSISDYKIISVKGDTTHVDTTLTIQEDYNHNYLRKDNFGLLPYSNVGQSYTRLKYDFDKFRLMPEFGARATHFNFYEVDDIDYYRVPTPWTELFFKTTFNQGQLLDASFTSNLTPQINFSVAYKGLRSLGKYQHLKASQGSFRTTFSYHSKNRRYQLHAHFLSQNIKAQQNGGLTDLSNEQFKSKSDQYNNREVLDTKFTDAEGFLRPKRFFIKHHFDLIPGIDSTANNRVRIGHVFNFTDKEYYYDQGSPFALFGKPFDNSSIQDVTEFQDISNTLTAQYQNNLLGKVAFKVKHSHYNYGYQRKLHLDQETIPNRLKGNIFAVGASYEKKIAGIEISGDAMLNVTGDFNGNYLRGKAAYDIDSLNRVEAGISTNSHQPNYNFLLYQSDYKNYNWRNDFKNIQRQRLYFKLHAPKIVNVKAEYNRIHNYTYFGLRDNPDSEAEADTLLTPYQYGGDISYFKIKAGREFNFGRFSLNNTVMYQEVMDGKDVFHVSPFITRNSIYYSDRWFHRNLFVQTGFTFNYFSSFKVDGYDPVMAEHFVQNEFELQGFSRLDFFFNIKVTKMRAFFKLENLTTLLEGNGNFAAPYQPYRDWVIRFGIIWDFFL